jgi:hypothetical protein
MKNVLCKSSFIVNLIEGVAAVIALTVSYAFMFERDNQDHDMGLGVFILAAWIFVLLVPNLVFRIVGKFHMKDTLFFQFAPLLLGAVLYTVYQLVLH